VTYNLNTAELKKKGIFSAGAKRGGAKPSIRERGREGGGASLVEFPRGQSLYPLEGGWDTLSYLWFREKGGRLSYNSTSIE